MHTTTLNGLRPSCLNSELLSCNVDLQHLSCFYFILFFILDMFASNLVSNLPSHVPVNICYVTTCFICSQLKRACSMQLIFSASLGGVNDVVDRVQHGHSDSSAAT